MNEFARKVAEGNSNETPRSYVSITLSAVEVDTHSIKAIGVMPNIHDTIISGDW